MSAAAGTSGSGEPDMALVGELLEEVSRHAPAIQARKLLVEHYISVGWLDAAMENAKELKRLAPQDSDVTGFLDILNKKPEPPAPDTTSTSTRTVPPKLAPAPALAPRRKPVPVQLPANLDHAKKDLEQGYKSLRDKAKFLLVDLLHLQTLQKKQGLPQSQNTAKIQAIADGRSPNASNRAHAPGSARSLARLMQADPEKASELAFQDLEDSMNWIRAPHGKASGKHNDEIRDALAKRVHALESALPGNLKIIPEVALMHIEHEFLKTKNYVNDETMLGDAVTDIPRENFYVTEDGYAWDMDELAQAITANGGIMRNPLSRQMFTPKDIRGIVSHPEGKRLAALQVEQHEMSKGVRPDTIDHLDKLGKILLEDQSSDQLASRHAIDEFMAYCATLPEAEQKCLNGLKCPAKDSHTGQSYDFTIGEAVRDAKGNRVCFHKTGDFIQQAARHLRANVGAPPPDPDKCAVM
ncbi:hypothetical protein BCR34DRAFT_477973 [Clohesyomyces aquaticus]|uniref:Uncharacterized protein n=1 Tax=Clohesyomyces aquaticus TaxID=1231657 RepID=A0A1Y1ZZ42_9PLEO|nr:hypothetical protein BCR34DRAFT_477973 [Clohesyomyces aquaticus]